MQSVQKAPFCVDETAYCIWSADLAGQNKRFLDALDPKYFTFQAEILGGALGGEDDKYAAIALRSAYFHAVEFALAFTFAALQAPGAVFAWLQKYKTAELINLCRKVANNELILSRYKLAERGWDGVVAAILSCLPEVLITEDAETPKQTVVDGYAKCLRAIGSEIQDEGFFAEYNDIKHGFRIFPGGFTLAFREEKSLGVEDPEKPWHSLGGSKHGSSVPKLTVSPFQKHHLGFVMISRNWDASQMAERIDVLRAWISCVKSSVQLGLGVAEAPANFAFSSDEGSYMKPWSPTGGVINMKMGMDIEFVKDMGSKEAIIATYKKKSESDGVAS